MPESTLSFGELQTAPTPPLLPYPTRRGRRLTHRFYVSQKTSFVVIVIHGSSTHSRYLAPLSHQLSERLGAVYTPDLRGHGVAPERRGDVDYVGQLEDDLEDLMHFIQERHPAFQILMIGHSSGGGLVLRYAGNPNRPQALAYVLLAPFLRHDVPTIKQPPKVQWAKVKLLKLLVLLVLHRFNIKAFQATPVIDFNLPEAYRDGTETLSYSFRLHLSYHSMDYLEAVSKPLCVLVGQGDELFEAKAFPALIEKHSHGQCRILEGLNHLKLAQSEKTVFSIEEWIQEREGVGKG